MKQLSKKLRLKRLWIFLAVVLGALFVWPGSVLSPTLPEIINQQLEGPKPTASRFNKRLFPTDQASSLWAVVNKGRALPSGYKPAGLRVPQVPLNGSASSDNMHLRAEAAGGLEEMVNAAKADGIKLVLVSGYRSFYTQSTVYSGYVSSQGQTYADTISARPGHSEHQTGLAADVGALSGICQLEQCFGTTAEGRWLSVNAPKYGFIIRYQQGMDNLTGYIYEPWHLRYVGKELAAELPLNQTLEQFFGLPAYTTYSAGALKLQ